LSPTQCYTPIAFSHDNNAYGLALHAYKYDIAHDHVHGLTPALMCLIRHLGRSRNQRQKKMLILTPLMDMLWSILLSWVLVEAEIETTNLHLCDAMLINVRKKFAEIQELKGCAVMER
jgi:hypothetical protein